MARSDRKTNRSQSATGTRTQKYRFAVILALVIATFLIFVRVIPSGGQRASQELVARGADHLAAGDRGRAIAAWERALQQDPSNASALELVGDAYIAARDWKRAADVFSRLVEVAPDRAEAYSRLAGCTVRLRDFAAGYRYAQEELKRNPTSVPALLIAAKLGRMQEGELQQMDYLRRLVKAQPRSAEYLLMYGRALSNQSRYTEAAQVLDRVLQLQQNNATANAHRGLASLQRASTEPALREAERYFRRALEEAPDYGFAHYYLGKTYLRGRRHLQAIPHLERATRLWPTIPDVWYELAQAYNRVGQDAKAKHARRRFEAARNQVDRLSRLETFYRANPGDANKLPELAQLSVQTGNARKAQYYLAQALKHWPDDQRLKGALAELSARPGEDSAGKP